MANEQNLKPVRNKKEARERGKKGGIASGAARRKKRTLREIMEAYGEAKNEDGLTNDEKMVLAQYRLAQDEKAKGSTAAATFIRDTKGEKPVDKAEVGVVEYKPLVDLTKRKKNGSNNQP